MSLLPIFPSTDQYKTLFNVCFFLKTLLEMCCWFIDIELMSTNTHAWWSFSNTTFLHKIHYSLLTLTHTTHYFSTRLGVILNGEIINKKHKNAKNLVFNWPWKEHLFAWWALIQGRHSIVVECHLGGLHWVTLIFNHSAHVCEGLQRHHKYWFYVYK